MDALAVIDYTAVFCENLRTTFTRSRRRWIWIYPWISTKNLWIWMGNSISTASLDIWASSFGRHRLSAMLRHCDVIEINSHIIGVQIVIVNKLANMISIDC